MTNLQDTDSDSSHRDVANGTTILAGQTGESAPNGTYPFSYVKGKKANEMKASKNNGNDFR